MFVCFAVIVVVTPYQELAEELSSRHRLPLQSVIISKETRTISSYRQRIKSALHDNNCQLLYFIWNHGSEEASRVTVPPLSDIVRELVPEPHSATELKKAVFVQLGFKPAPLNSMVHQLSLEQSPSDEDFNAQECADLIYDRVYDLQRKIEGVHASNVDAIDIAAQRTVLALPSTVIPPSTDQFLSQNSTSPSLQPTLCNTAMNIVALRSHSLPAIFEQLCTTESAVDNSPQRAHLGAQLETHGELFCEVRELHDIPSKTNVYCPTNFCQTFLCPGTRKCVYHTCTYMDMCMCA